MIDLYVRGQELIPKLKSMEPLSYLRPTEKEEGATVTGRVETPRASVEWRKRNFAEVEVGLSVKEARCEAGRCLRCDLEFAESSVCEPESEEVVVGGSAE
jgi:hypothetical protein